MGQALPDDSAKDGYAAGFATALHRDLARDADPDAAMRACIDLPISIRSHGLRLIVFAGAVLHARTDETRQSARDAWDRAMAGYRHVASCLDAQPSRILHESVRRLLIEVLPRHAETVRVIHHYPTVVDTLRRAAEAGRVTSEYDDLLEYVYETYTPAMMSLEARLADAVETHLAERRRTAQQARNRAQSARAKIEGIARTVRMIALNARVEAARAGEAGRAFDLIASEIHQLSARASEASAEMGSSIDAILERGSGRPGGR